MGEVYLAEDTSLHRRVAVKVVREGQAPARIARPASCARRARRRPRPPLRLCHPRGQHGRRPAVHRHGVRRGRDPRPRAAARSPSPAGGGAYRGEIAEALEAAHSKGLVHATSSRERDGHRRGPREGHGLRPRQGHVRCGSAGTEEETVTALTRTGVIAGTLAYMSPEQLRGLPLDGRSDLFALGILLQEAVSGTHPSSAPPLRPRSRDPGRDPPACPGRGRETPRPARRPRSPARQAGVRAVRDDGRGAGRPRLGGLPGGPRRSRRWRGRSSARLGLAAGLAFAVAVGATPRLPRSRAGLQGARLDPGHRLRERDGRAGVRRGLETALTVSLHSRPTSTSSRAPG